MAAAPNLNGTPPSQPSPAATSALSPPSTPSPASNTVLSFASDEVLFRALTSRKSPGKLKLTDPEVEKLVDTVIDDFQNADSTNRQYKENIAEMVANWRGTVEEKDYPFEGAANVHVPLTSVYVEQMKARLLKAVFGGELWAKLQYLEKQLEQKELDETNEWWHWELKEVVKLKEAFRDILHDVLVCGTSIAIPSYRHHTRFLHSFKTWDFDDNSQLSVMIQQGVEEILGEPSAWGSPFKYEISGQPKPGLFKLTAVEQDQEYEGGQVVFSLDLNKHRLRADIDKREVIFDGAQINYVSLEDLVCPNTDGDIEKLAFFGVRLWYSTPEYREGLADGFFIDYGQERNDEIVAGADYKQGDIIGRQITNLQDAEEGTDSKDTSTNLKSHQFLEVYRWEGWWTPGSKSSEQFEQLLQPAIAVCAWVDTRSKALLKIERLEDLNKDGKRSGVKFGFIHEPNRFYDLGVAEWVRHSQNILDTVSNQRLDSGWLVNLPWGLYKPTAGMTGPIRMEPGLLLPSADPQSLNIPPHNWNPAFSFEEESLQKSYADMQVGLSNQALGHAPSKRQSATEVVSTASALDLRTEDVLERLLESLKELLTRVLGLYQQFGPRERIFRVGGEGAIQITKRFERDRLQGKMLLTMCGNLEQINEQLQRQLAIEMFQLLLNQILIQTGIVTPKTISDAVKLIAKLHHYDVTLGEPNTLPMSDIPDVEEKQMFAGQKPTGPTLSENTSEHLQHHATVAADSRLMESWPLASRQLLEQHIQDTMKMHDAQQMIQKQQAIMATQMAQSMEQHGVRAGKPGGQKPSQNTGAGTGAEGAGAPTNSAPSPGQA